MGCRFVKCLSGACTAAMLAAPSLAALLLAAPQMALASEEFPLAGTYSQNKPCPVDAAVSQRLRVTITLQEIGYAAGTCAISDIRRKDNTFTLRTACRMLAGKVLSSDVVFTIRDDKHLDMVDQFASYKAVLYRCPEQPGDAAAAR